MIHKNQVLETVQQLPEEFSIDELIERLIIIQKIEDGRKEVKGGKVFTHEEAKERLKKWLL